MTTDTATAMASDELRGGISLDQLHTAVKHGTIRTVMTVVPDMFGRLKGKRAAGLALFERLGEGDGTRVGEACSYLLGTTFDMEPSSGFDLTSWTDGYRDMGINADWTTLRVLPHMQNMALVHCDAVDQDGAPHEVAPRQMLRRQLERLQELGYDAQVAWESEFVLYSGDRPVEDRNLDYDLDLHPRLGDFLGDLEDALPDAGVPVEAFKGEGAGGQVEATFPKSGVMEACDNFTVYKHLVKHLARRHGLTASFMAAPATGVASGLHLNLSLWQGEQPLFALPSPRALPTEIMGHSIAGLIAAVPNLMPLFAGSTNSYKRYATSHCFTPQFMNWGHDNRGCAIRVAGHGPSSRLEIRVAGAEANPYLVAAASLAAIAHGLDHKLTPPRPRLGDAYADDTSAPLPRDLRDALETFRFGHAARDLLGVEVVKHYGRAVQIEIDELNREVTDVERRRLTTA
ncbi:glutamine synthetase family protein [Streptomyces sp. NPDC091217]|uniref:glutamine synthetase family protein n=1 Tax=Streptomyces sp. NPDC091217 TaxID=3365975 RepID=UPI00382BE6A5